MPQRTRRSRRNLASRGEAGRLEVRGKDGDLSPTNEGLRFGWRSAEITNRKKERQLTSVAPSERDEHANYDEFVNRDCDVLFEQLDAGIDDREADLTGNDEEKTWTTCRVQRTKATSWRRESNTHLRSSGRQPSPPARTASLPPAHTLQRRKFRHRRTSASVSAV